MSVTGSIKEILKVTNVKETIQSIAFDPIKGEISIASQANNAAKGKFQTFSPDTLFSSHAFSKKASQPDYDHAIKLFRNLD